MSEKANILSRYIWLIKTVMDSGRISFREIDRRWRHCYLSDGSPYPKRSFDRHRAQIEDLFDINIDVEQQPPYRYYIEDQEQLSGDGLRMWLMQSYSTLDQLQADRSLRGRIHYEDVPSGYKWLTIITDAIRQGRTLTLTYEPFDSTENTYEVEPWALKIARRRWYMIGNSLYLSRRRGEPTLRNYALDRIKDITLTDNTFTVPDDFSLDKHFADSVGITTLEEPQQVVIKAYGRGADYLRTLPIHPSQHEIDSDDESVTFELFVRPNYDLLQEVLSLGEQVELLSPPSARRQLKMIIDNMTEYYEQ